MDLNLTQLRDLEYICEIARYGLTPEYYLPKEQDWIQRIEKYRELFKAEIDRLERESGAPEVE